MVGILPLDPCTHIAIAKLSDRHSGNDQSRHNCNTVCFCHCRGAVSAVDTDSFAAESVSAVDTGSFAAESLSWDTGGPNGTWNCTVDMHFDTWDWGNRGQYVLIGCMIDSLQIVVSFQSLLSQHSAPLLILQPNY